MIRDRSLAVAAGCAPRAATASERLLCCSSWAGPRVHPASHSAVKRLIRDRADCFSGQHVALARCGSCGPEGRAPRMVTFHDDSVPVGTTRTGVPAATAGVATGTTGITPARPTAGAVECERGL